MQADRALVEFPRIQYAMHRIGGIHGARLGDIHLDNVGGLEPAGSTFQILVHEMKVLYLQAPDRNRHPAILVAMIVH